MLVEKIGQATFYIEDEQTGRRTEVQNRDYLTPYQEKQMAIQPDLILQFAHIIANDYQERFGFEQPNVKVQSYVALNGRASQQFIDPNVNLVNEKDNFYHKKWILQYPNH